MLIDATTQNPDVPGAADILVVGAGAVGLILAVDLARTGRRVVVVEAGGSSISSGSQSYFESAVWDGYPLEGLHVGRFRALGGTTNFWGGQLVPPPAAIFRPRPWISDAAWPIAEDDVSPFYARVFDLLDMGKRIESDQEVWKRISAKSPAASDEVEIFLTRWAPKTNFAQLFGDDIARNPNLLVITNAPVTALHMDDTAAVTGVEIATAAGRRTIGARRVVLANGTVEIVRLLKLPLSDGRAAPWANNPWLGRCFMDHVDCIAGNVVPIDARKFHDCFDNIFLDGLKYCPKLRPTEQAEERDRAVGTAAVFAFNSSLQEHLGNFKIFARALLRGKFDRRILSYPGRLLDIAKVAVPMISRYIRYRRMYNPADQGIRLILTTEQIPIPDSEILLEDSRDDLGMPLVRVRWQIDGRELKTMANFAIRLRDYLLEKGLARVALDPLLENCDPAFLSKIDDANHQMGGARMSARAEDGVVDENASVYGGRNLFVAGAVLFPTAGFQNPTFLAMALALRLGRHLCGLQR